MFNTGTSPSLADIAAVTGGNRNNDGWGDGNGWWVLIILFAISKLFVVFIFVSLSFCNTFYHNNTHLSRIFCKKILRTFLLIFEITFIMFHFSPPLSFGVRSSYLHTPSLFRTGQ